MDEALARRARERGGVLLGAELGDHPARTARRHGLVAVQPRVLMAATQPLGPSEQLAAVRESVTGAYAFAGVTALWRYGLSGPPDAVQVAVPHGTRYRARPPVRVTRVCPALLAGSRTVAGARLISVEVALLQAARQLRPPEHLAVLEDVLRSRRTTFARLRSRCGRGVAGSAAVRRALDELAGTSLDGAVRQLLAALADRGITGLRTEVRYVSATGCSAWADAVDDAGRTVLEVDGYLTHAERSRFTTDRRRDRWMSADHGMTTYRIDVAELRRDLPAVADEVAALLLARRRSVALAG